MKILVIQQKMIGDVLTTSILFEALKEKFPTSNLHYLINSHTYPVVENNPFIDEFIFYTPEMEKSKMLFFSLLQDIKKQKYNIVIDVYGKISSNLISLFSKSDLKISYHKFQSYYIFKYPIKRKNKPEYGESLAVENRMLLLEPLDISFKNYKPNIYMKQYELDCAKTYLESLNIDLKKPLIMIGVLGSNLNKTYPFNYMAKILDTIVDSKPNVQILFNYIPNQKKDATTVFNLCKQKTQYHIHFNVYGKNLREFLSITSYCDALIGNEGGANNIAKALQIPTFTIFSPYLNKHNWFGEVETKKHVAIHLKDYVDYNVNEAKQDIETYYNKLKPSLFTEKLKFFIKKFN